MNSEPAPVAEDVIYEVADETDRPPLDLPPLHDIIDTDALESIVHSLPVGQITFTYAGCTVSVDSSGRVCTDPGGVMDAATSDCTDRCEAE